jgi:hypothetical protein
MVPLLRVPVDPSVEQAREWVQRELSKVEYADDRSLLQRVLEWVDDFISDLMSRGLGGLPGWALPVVVGGLLGLLALVLIVKVRREPSREGRAGGAVIEDPRLDADGYRARAQRAFDAGELDAAAADWFRAITAAASERAITDDSPGRTAHEVGVALAAVFPEEAGGLARAADHFDAVRYGDGHVDAGTARLIADLDRRLASERPFLERAAAQ